MTREYFMRKIGLPEDGQKSVITFNIDENIYYKWKDLFYKNTDSFLHKVDCEENSAELLLYLYIRFAEDIYPGFQKRNLSDKIYFDTFSDFTIWFRWCKKKGRIGLTEGQWLSLPLKLKIVRLGRLQFEPEREKSIIHVHIPEGAPLTAEFCEDSFNQAGNFFGRGYRLFDCESWLLSPALTELLAESSNILQFQKRFEILRTEYPFRQAEERVFGEILSDKTQYPEKTSLQKELKAYVLSGRDVGVGYGIINRSHL